MTCSEIYFSKTEKI